MNPVIVIPGYYGTKLAFGDDEEEILWLDGKSFVQSGSTLRALRFDPRNPDEVVPVGVLDEVAIIEPFIDPDIYKKLIRFLKDQNLRYFDGSYDWRRSMREEADRLAARVDAALQDTGARKVDLVGHSFGGLLARAYLKIHGAEKVQRLITIGAPHKGMLRTFEAVSNGMRVLVTFKAKDVRETARTCPSAFELLPNDPRDRLFEWGGQPRSALADRRWCDFAVGSPSPGAELRRMTEQAERDVIDLLPSHLPVETHVIYGTRCKTPGKALRKGNRLVFEDIDDGDGTVPTISASGRGLVGPDGRPPRHYPIPFGSHMLLFGDRRVEAILANLLVGPQGPPAPAYFQARFEKELVRKRGWNRLSVDLCDDDGPITDAEVRLTIRDTNIRDRPVPVSERGDYLLERVIMPARRGRLSYRIEAEVPGIADTLVREGSLRVV